MSAAKRREAATRAVGVLARMPLSAIIIRVRSAMTTSRRRWPASLTRRISSAAEVSDEPGGPLRFADMDGSGPDSPLLANVFTLGVRDLGRQRDFYRSLGFPQIVDDADFAAFELHGAVLALFSATKLAADGRGDHELGRGGIRFTIGIVVRHASEVDRLADRFRAAGGRITKEPTDAEFFPGRSAYVADTEDNFFEIVWAEPDNAIVAAAYRAARLAPPAT